MADDFQAGDVVVRVIRGPRNIIPVGTICRVIAVRIGHYEGSPSLALILAGWAHGPGTVGWEHRFFKKLPKADEQFAADMRACRPHRNRVPA